jgi:hypothetical protein
MTLDQNFAEGVREQLIATARGSSPIAARTRHTRIALGLGSAIGAASLLTAGALVVAGITPGSHIVSELGGAVSESNTGTATVELGERPSTANAVQFTITCTSAGAFEVSYADTYGPSGTSWVCSDTPDLSEGTVPVGHTVTLAEQPLAEGETSFVVTTDPGTTWNVVAQYANSVTTDWGVNANGQTYGTPNENGSPDLTAAQATNGEVGYIYSDQQMNDTQQAPHTLPVYESDGVTVIGEFPIGDS